MRFRSLKRAAWCDDVLVIVANIWWHSSVHFLAYTAEEIRPLWTVHPLRVQFDSHRLTRSNGVRPVSIGWTFSFPPFYGSGSCSDVLPREWKGRSKISGFRGQESFHHPIARWTTTSPIQIERRDGSDVLQQRFVTHSPRGCRNLARCHRGHRIDDHGRCTRRCQNASTCTCPCRSIPSLPKHRRGWSICPGGCMHP